MSIWRCEEVTDDQSDKSVEDDHYGNGNGDEMGGSEDARVLLLLLIFGP